MLLIIESVYEIRQLIDIINAIVFLVRLCSGLRAFSLGLLLSCCAGGIDLKPLNSCFDINQR